MKKLLIFPFLLLTVAACEQQNEPQPDNNPVLTPLTESITADAAGDTCIINYRLDYPQEGTETNATSPDTWITVIDKTEPGTIVVAVEANESGESRNSTVSVTYGSLGFDVPVAQEAMSGQDDPDIPDEFDQIRANSELAVNYFTEFDVASIDEQSGTVVLAEDHKAASSGWFEFNDEWATKTYTSSDGSKYRVPTADEYYLIAPSYFENDPLCFASERDIVGEEILPENIFGKEGGSGESHFKTSAAQEIIGDGDGERYTVYALRFLGTSQRSAYQWSWVNKGSETDAYLCVRIKALQDDQSLTIDDIVDNEDYWAADYIELKFSATGMNFGGEPFLQGYSADRWTATAGGLNAQNPGASDYARTFTYTESSAFIGDTSKTNLVNLRMVKVD